MRSLQYDSKVVTTQPPAHDDGSSKNDCEHNAARRGDSPAAGTWTARSHAPREVTMSSTSTHSLTPHSRLTARIFSAPSLRTSTVPYSDHCSGSAPGRNRCRSAQDRDSGHTGIVEHFGRWCSCKINRPVSRLSALADALMTERPFCRHAPSHTLGILLMPAVSSGCVTRFRPRHSPANDRAFWLAHTRYLRFIPAPAGNGPNPESGGLRVTVHPRACGERCFTEDSRGRWYGSSPRLRGTVHDRI